MGLGSKRKRRNIYYANLKTKNEKEQVDPHFVVSYKKEGREVKQRENEISGKLFSIKCDSYMYNNEKQNTIVIQLVDGADLFQIEVNIEVSMARTIVNSILGNRDKGYDGVVFFRTYTKKKEGSDVVYPQIYVGGEAKGSGWDWKFKPKDVETLIEKFYNPKRKTGTAPGVPNDTDYSALNTMLLEHFDALAKDINPELALMNPLEESEDEEESTTTTSTSPAAAAPAPTIASAPVPSTSTPNPENTDDLPF